MQTGAPDAASAALLSWVTGAPLPTWRSADADLIEVAATGLCPWADAEMVADLQSRLQWAAALLDELVNPAFTHPEPRPAGTEDTRPGGLAAHLASRLARMNAAIALLAKELPCASTLTP